MQTILHNGSLTNRQPFLSKAFWATVSLFVMVFVMGLVKIYSPDLGFHLKSAKWMLDNKQFIYTDSFSSSSEGNRYYDMQWLFQLLVYNLYHSFGEAVLITVNAVLITLSITLVWVRFIKNTHSNISDIKLGFFVFLAILFIQPLTFEIRPHVLSWIFLNGILFFLESYKRTGKNVLYCLPILMLFWVNSHSLSILGLVTIGIYNVGSWLESKKVDKKLLLYSILSFAVFLINPYFVEGLLYPFTQLGLISGGNLPKEYIGEFQSPFSLKEVKLMGYGYFSSPLLLVHVVAVLSIFSIVISLKKRQFTETLLLFAFLILLHLANKNYGYFLMVSLPLCAKYLLEWFQARQQKILSQRSTLVNKTAKKTNEDAGKSEVKRVGQHFYVRLSILSSVLAIFITVTTISDGYSIFRNSPFRFGLTVDKEQLPVDATNFLIKNNIKGKLLNHLNFGGYLMYHYDQTVFIDGRLEIIQEDVFDKYYKSLTERNGMKRLLDEYNPDIVIFPFNKATNWWEYFLVNRNNSGFKAVYFDELSVVYLRSSSYPEIVELTESSILYNMDSSAANRINESINLSKPKGIVALMNGCWNKQTLSLSNQNKATYCFTNGFERAALGYSVLGIETSTVHPKNIFKNLSIYFEERKMYDEAQICEEKSR